MADERRIITWLKSCEPSHDSAEELRARRWLTSCEPADGGRAANQAMAEGAESYQMAEADKPEEAMRLDRRGGRTASVVFGYLIYALSFMSTIRMKSYKRSRYIIWLVVAELFESPRPPSGAYTKRAGGLVFVRLTEYTSGLGPPVM